MPTAQTAQTTTPRVLPQDKFSVDKSTSGGISLLTMRGTVNDAFEGKKLAESVRTKKLVINMRDVRRFASWGMSEWMEFLRINADRDLYLVECSTYAVSQINLVTGLLGHGKLVSFYASYRCGSCSEELETLFVIPRDRDAIRDLPGSYQECATCGGRARLEEYPAAFFDTIANRPSFDIDDEVLAYFRSHYKYDLAPDLTRFRAYRAQQGGYTYLRLSGSLQLLPADVLTATSEGTTVVDLANVIFNPADTTAWRTYLQAARAKVKALQLLDCPIGFLETALTSEDLRDKVKVRTFALAYDCLRCETTTAHLVDVAENLEFLVEGTAPQARCTACKSLLVAVPTHEQIDRFRALPARERDAALDKFLAKARTEAADKLENCLTVTPKPPPKAAGGGRAIYVALALGTLVVAGLGVVAWQLWKQREEAPKQAAVIAATTNPTTPTKPTFTRPDWIVSDVPSSAYCHDMINRLMCVGVSSYRATRDEAATEATDAALEELVSAIGLKVTDPYFREQVLPGYSDVRQKAMLALQAADIDRASPAYVAADEAVRKARKRVVEILHASGGAAVPTQRSDWYWEEYAGEKGQANEVLVFVRYDITLDAVRTLVDKYAQASSYKGTTALTVFPALAWRDAELTGGALLTKVGKPLAGAGIAPQSIVSAIGDQRVSDAATFTRRLEESLKAGGELTLTVKTGDTAPQPVTVKR